MKEITPFLMFQGNAKQAIEFYLKTVPNTELVTMELYEVNEQGTEGTVKSALLLIDGNRFFINDSPVEHKFDFTPSFSFFITADSVFEQQDLFNKLKRNGAILMPLDNYGFSRSFGWCIDQFGMSWQITVE